MSGAVYESHWIVRKLMTEHGKIISNLIHE
jgi:hypothetical protein